MRHCGFIGVSVLVFAAGVGCGGLAEGGGTGGAGTGGTGSGATGGAGSGGTGVSGSGGQGTGGKRAQGCALALGVIDGSYLMALSLVTAGNKSNKDRPIVLQNTVKTSLSGDALQVSWSLQPLKFEDRKTPTGSALQYSFSLGPGGGEVLNLPPLDVPADANPLSGSAITLNLWNLTGVSCSAVSFQCGTGDGDVTKPISLSIAGSTWTMERIVGGEYPEPPKIDCEKNLASPLPLPPL